MQSMVFFTVVVSNKLSKIFTCLTISTLVLMFPNNFIKNKLSPFKLL